MIDRNGAGVNCAVRRRGRTAVEGIANLCSGSRRSDGQLERRIIKPAIHIELCIFNDTGDVRCVVGRSGRGCLEIAHVAGERLLPLQLRINEEILIAAGEVQPLNRQHIHSGDEGAQWNVDVFVDERLRIGMLGRGG